MTVNVHYIRRGTTGSNRHDTTEACPAAQLPVGPDTDIPVNAEYETLTAVPPVLLTIQLMVAGLGDVVGLLVLHDDKLNCAGSEFTLQTPTALDVADASAFGFTVKIPL